MLEAEEQRSEVARLLTAINAEYRARQQALSGLAAGVSRHEFMTAKTERIGRLHAQLQGIVGEGTAMAMIADQLQHLE